MVGVAFVDFGSYRHGLYLVAVVYPPGSQNVCGVYYLLISVVLVGMMELLVSTHTMFSS